MMKNILLIGGVAIQAFDAMPYDDDRGMLVCDDIAYADLSLATANILQIANVPGDFVGGKYSLNAAADGLEPNLAYVAPAAPAPEVVPVKEWPALDFYNRFSHQQRVSIRAAAATDPFVEDLVKTLELYIADRRVVRHDGGSLSQGLAHLVSTAVLTQAEVDALVA